MEYRPCLFDDSTKPGQAQFGPSGLLGGQGALAAPPSAPRFGGTPSRNQGPSNQQTRHDPIPPTIPPGRKPNPEAKGPGGAIFLGPPQSMQSATVTLTPGQPFDFLGSDGRFELLVPAGAITAADVAAAGGRIQLRIEQVLGASGGARSGHVILGGYRITVLGAHNQPLGLFAFHQPLTYRYHYTKADLGLIEPEHAFVGLEDGSAVPRPAPGSNPRTQTVWPSTSSTSFSSHPATNDPAAHTISFTQSGTAGGGDLTSPGGALLPTFGTNAPVASWGTVQDFQTDTNAGALSFSQSLDLPPGPGGLVPALQLAYSSGSVNETENLQSSASWVGEGWSLQLGSISWAQQDGNSCCGVATLQNVWNITTPDGISGQLIPPSPCVNTSNVAPDTVTCTPSSQVPQPPIQWYTAPESHTKIIEITSSANGGYPCFRLWRPDGTLEEYGCTADSRQYYVDIFGTQHTTGWDLDMIANPHGDQVVVTYDQVMRTKSGTSYQQVVDAVMKDVFYDFPTCPHNTPITRCDPSTYPALVDVHFDTNNKPARFSGTSTSACTGWTANPGSDRCDNPTSPSGGLVAPDIHSVHILNDVKVQVRPTTSGSLSLLRAYLFWYEQSGGTTVTDPVTNSQEGTAGYLDLTQVQEFGTDATFGATPTGTSYPPLSFSYTGSYQERYEDVAMYTKSTTACAPWYTYGTGGGNHGLEVVVEETNGTSNYLVNYWRDMNYVWHKGVTFADGIQSGPATVVNSSTGNLEVVVRRNGVLAHYWRDTQGHWNGPVTFGNTESSAPGLAYNSANGNLDVVVREGSQIAHYYHSGADGTAWTGPDQTFGSSVTGRVSLAYNGATGNLEVVALTTGGQIVHYWRTGGTTWNGPETFGDTGVTYQGVSVAYNGNSTLPGSLEVIATENNQLVYYYRDSSWHKFSTPYGSSIATGPADQINLDNGNLDVVAQNNSGQLQHYFIYGGPTWNGPTASFGDGSLSVAAPGLQSPRSLLLQPAQERNQQSRAVVADAVPALPRHLRQRARAARDLQLGRGPHERVGRVQRRGRQQPPLLHGAGDHRAVLPSRRPELEPRHPDAHRQHRQPGAQL